MARRFIDISVPLKAGIRSDPPGSLPQIEYLDHHQTAPRMAEYMKPENMPFDGKRMIYGGFEMRVDL